MVGELYLSLKIKMSYSSTAGPKGEPSSSWGLPFEPLRPLPACTPSFLCLERGRPCILTAAWRLRTAAALCLSLREGLGSWQKRGTFHVLNLRA